MKRKLMIALLAALLLCGCGAAGEEKAPKEAAQTQTETERFEFDIYDENDKLFGKGVQEFDERGRLLREEWFDLEGNSTNLWEYRYEGDSEACQSWSERYLIYDENGVPTGYGLCEVNALNEVIWEEQYDLQGNLLSRWKNDPGGGGPRIVEEDIYDENGVVCGHSVCEYDEFDRITLEEEFDTEGNCTNRWERSYSEDGLECVTLCYSYGELTTKMVSICNEQGMTVELRSYDNRGALFAVNYYDETGAETLTEYYAGEPGAEWKSSEQITGTDGSVENVSYNPDGSFAGRDIHIYDGPRSRYILYDDQGNFVWDQVSIRDERGFETRLESYDESGAMLEYRIMDYTAEGLECLKEDYSGTGELMQRTVTEYREDGQKLSVLITDGSGATVEQISYEYDELQRLRRRSSVDGEGQALKHSTCKYEEDGSYVMYHYYGESRLVGRDYYDAEGVLLESIDET